MQKYLLLSPPFYTLLETIDSAIRQEKEKKDTQLGKGKPSLFADMIIFTENSKESTLSTRKRKKKKKATGANEFSKVEGYKANIQNQVYLTCYNQQLDIEIKMGT